MNHFWQSCDVKSALHQHTFKPLSWINAVALCWSTIYQMKKFHDHEDISGKFALHFTIDRRATTFCDKIICKLWNCAAPFSHPHASHSLNMLWPGYLSRGNGVVRFHIYFVNETLGRVKPTNVRKLVRIFAWNDQCDLDPLLLHFHAFHSMHSMYMLPVQFERANFHKPHSNLQQTFFSEIWNEPKSLQR